MNMKYRLIVAAFAMVAGAFGVFGATLSYDADETVDAPLALAEDTEISVAEGVTVTYAAAITGGYKLTKTGAGTLVLAAESPEFSGGIEIQMGVVDVRVDNALGTGDVAIVGTTNDKRQLRFGDHTEAITVPNRITVSSAATMPSIIFDGSYLGTSLMKAVTFTGGICAQSNLMMCDYLLPSYTGFSLTFDCEVDATGYDITFPVGCTPSWKKTVKAKAFIASGGYSTTAPNGKTCRRSGGHRFKVPNELEVVRFYYDQCFGDCAHCFDGSIIDWTNYTADSSSGRGGVNLAAGEHTLTYLTSAVQGTKYPDNCCGLYGAAAGSTVTVTGTTAVASAKAYCALRNGLSFVLDAPDFKQTLANRTHNMTGILTVMNGTLELTGATTFGSATAVNVQGGTLDCLTTAAGCFASITNLTIAASGTLNFAATATTPVPEDSSMDFEIGTGSTISLAEPTTWHVRRFVVDGKCKGIDTWTSANCAALPENLTVVSSVTDAEDIEEIGWKGGADDFTAPENWGKTGEPLDFTGNKYVATFAAEDAVTHEATVSDPVSLHGIVFAGTDFGLRAADDSAALSLFEGQIDFADDQDANEESHAYTNDVPITFFDDAVINVPAKDTLTLGDVTTTHGLDFTGKGTTYLDGDVQVDGPMKFRSGRVYLRGTIAAVGHVAQANTADVRLNLNYAEASMSSIKYSLVLDGGVIEKPIFAKAYTGGDPLLATTANTENYITGPFEGTSPVAAISVGTGSTLTMSGGETFSWSIRKEGYGLLVITNKPFLVSNSGAMFSLRYGTLRLDVAGNHASSSMSVQSGARLETTVDKAFSCVVFSHAGTADFKNTFQSVSHVSSTSGNAVLTGEYGSCLMVSKGPALPVGGTNVSCQVTGGLSLAMGGTGVLLLTNQTFTSYGDLTVTNGVLELAANASWLNGTNFTARGSGTLKFAAAKQVDRKIANLHFAESGKIYVPAGVTLKVAAADVLAAGSDEPTPVALGTYDGATGLLEGRIEGGGSVMVGPPGLILLFR